MSETFEFPINSAFGEELPVEYRLANVKATYSPFATVEEIPTGKRLTDDQYLGAVNARQKAAARAKATTEALDVASKAFVASGKTGINPYEKPDQNTLEVQTENMIKLTMKIHKVNYATAKAIQDAASGAILAAK